MKKKKLIGLLLTLYISTALAAPAQPLTDKKNLSIHFKPVLIQEVVEEAHRVENTIYSATVKLKWGLQVEK